MPPRESPPFLATTMASFIFMAASESGHLTSFEYLFCDNSSKDIFSVLQIILPIDLYNLLFLYLNILTKFLMLLLLPLL